MRTRLLALTAAASAGLLAAGCGTSVNKVHANAAAAPFNGASHPAYAAAGGPANPPGTAPEPTYTSPSTASTTPTHSQLMAALLGKEDLPYTASAYSTTSVGSPSGCAGAVFSAAGSTTQAGEAFYQSPNTSPGANAYPASGSGGPSGTLEVAEVLLAYPPGRATSGYSSIVSALSHCSSFSLVFNGSPVQVTNVNASSGTPFGSQSSVFIGDLSYRGSHLHAIASIGVVDNVVAMVAYMSQAAPDNAVLSQYTGKAEVDIKAHIHS
ncbi:MAG TPA: hypothetical protein VKU91_03535 [Acidimicrobiales bacterium]|nr:hypothetical protein [Acidimicrobiales bacterium]